MSSSSWKRLLQRLRPATGYRKAPRRQPARPCLEVLEDRLAPAFDLGITTLATVKVDTTFEADTNTTFFTANDSGANLDVADIRAELLAGHNVRITTGSAGAEDGNITWTAGSDLDVNGVGPNLSLALRPDPSGTVQGITFAAQIFDSDFGADAIDVVFDAPFGPGGVDAGAGIVSAARDFFANSFQGTVTLGLTVASGRLSAGGNVLQLANNIFGGSLIDLVGPNGIRLLGDVQVSTNSESDVINFVGAVDGAVPSALTVLALDGQVQFSGPVGAGGNLTDLSVTARETFVQGDITLTDAAGPAELVFSGRDVVIQTAVTIDLTGSPAGSFVAVFLDVEQGGRFLLNDNLTVNLPSAADAFDMVFGTLDIRQHTLTTNGMLQIGVSITPDPQATLTGTGIVNAAAVNVGEGCSIALDRGEAPGDLTVQSDVHFLAGSLFDVSLSQLHQLLVNGTVTIDPAARLIGRGFLPGVGPFPFLTATAVAGTFQGTAGMAPVVVGGDLVTAAYSATSLELSQVPAGPNTVRGVDASGALYAIKLRGGGAAQLVVHDDPGTPGIEAIVVRQATLANRLRIRVQAEGGSPFVTVGTLGVEGSIGAIKAAAANIDGLLLVSGRAKWIRLRDLAGELTAGGPADRKTELRGRVLNAAITVGSQLRKLKAVEIAGGSIAVPAIGTLAVTGLPAEGLAGNLLADITFQDTLGNFAPAKFALRHAEVAGQLGGDWLAVEGLVAGIDTVLVQGDAVGWSLNYESPATVKHIRVKGQVQDCHISIEDEGSDDLGRLNFIQAGEWIDTAVEVAAIGTFRVIGNVARGLAGDYRDSTMFLDVNDLPGSLALESFSVVGAATGSTFIIQGNVTSFVAGKFLGSRLYVGLSEDGSLTAGTFEDDFKIGTFRTTAVPLDPPNPDPLTDGFANSEVCASRFGKVRLSGVTVDTGGVPFGLRVASAANAGSVRVATLPFPLGVDLPTGTIQGDFAFVALA